MNEVVFLLEEPSAQDLLEGLVPRLIPGHWSVRYIPFQGKQDLEKRLVNFLRAWRNREARFVVMRDQDSGDCRTIKSNLLSLCRKARRPDALIRVACRELESWVLGDLDAFGREFECVQATRQSGKAKFRNPDAIGSPVQELRRFVPTYQKREGAKRMGPLLIPDQNSSTSFRMFCRGLIRLVAEDSEL